MINSEKLKTFLYVLMRDELPSGKIEGIMRGFIGSPLSTSLNPDKGFTFKPGEYSNKYLEAHVIDIMKRLEEKDETVYCIWRGCAQVAIKDCLVCFHHSKRA